MELHENVILDLLPAVRAGRASAESRQLVERHLAAHPQLAQVAALMPDLDPALELRALQSTRRALGRVGWVKGLAIFLTLLPLSFMGGEGGVRFLWAGQPALVAVMLATAAAMWLAYARMRRGL